MTNTQPAQDPISMPFSLDSQPDFAGKVALITGAGRSLGQKIALAFAQKGAILAVNDITPINLDITIDQIMAGGGKVKGYISDISRRMPVQSMIDQVLEDLNQIDFLVNANAVKPQAALIDMDEWDWQRTLDVNLGSPFFCIQQVGRAMRQQGSGVIVNIAWAAGDVSEAPGYSAYFTSMYGLYGLTRAAAQEFAGQNIRLNTVYTGRPDGKFISPGVNPPGSASINIPMDFPVEVTKLVLFLCSQAAVGLTGLIINASNGEVFG